MNTGNHAQDTKAAAGGRREGKGCWEWPGPLPQLGEQSPDEGASGEPACWVEGATFENVPEGQREDGR